MNENFNANAYSSNINSTIKHKTISPCCRFTNKRLLKTIKTSQEKKLKDQYFGMNINEKKENKDCLY